MNPNPEYRKIKGRNYMHLYREKWLCVDKQTLDARYYTGELDKDGNKLPANRQPFHNILIHNK